MQEGKNDKSKTNSLIWVYECGQAQKWRRDIVTEESYCTVFRPNKIYCFMAPSKDPKYSQIGLLKIIFDESGSILGIHFGEYSYQRASDLSNFDEQFWRSFARTVKERNLHYFGTVNVYIFQYVSNQKYWIFFAERIQSSNYCEENKIQWKNWDWSNSYFNGVFGPTFH